MDLQEVACEGMGWIDVDEDRYRWWAFEITVINLRVL
jgi:hypothetical protein